MAKAQTSTLTTPLLSVNAVPAVVAAQAKTSEVAQRRADAGARLQRYVSMLRPSAEGAAVDVLDRLFAQRHHADAELEAIQLERELLEAQQAEALAREQARDEVATAFEPRMRQAVADLKAALLNARDKNRRLQRVQVERHEATSRPFDSLAWLEFGVRLNTWLRAIKAAGLDDAADADIEGE